MNIAKSTGPARPRGLLFAALLAVILAVLFAKSFLPGYVHFSNDGPLGQIHAAFCKLPSAFNGSWYDLTDLGNGAGAMAPAPSALIFWALGPVGYAKFLAPLALFILGLGAWTFFRQLRLSPLAATLGALAATLNSAFFATACWGVAPQQIAIGMDFFALALVVSNVAGTPRLIRWTRLALAGLAVGVNVMEAADIGAIFSVFVAAFVLVRTVTDEGGAAWAKWGHGIGRVAVVAVFAGFIATQTILALVGAAIVGIPGTGQDTETKTQHWYWATAWSEPKMETLGLFVPGLFGYRLDTPNNMMGFLQNNYQGGNYWGTVGNDPSLDSYFDWGRKGPIPPGQIRFTGGQNYAGILVALLAFWAIAQSLRRQNSVFTATQKRLVWFWAVVLIGTLLLAYGRFAPFYKLFYLLPYASTIRCPSKFLLVFSWAIIILFAYGIHGLSRRYLEIPAANSASWPAQLKNWWAKIRGFDRNWTFVCGVAFLATVLGWRIYASEKPGLVRYLQTVGFGDESTAEQIAAFSIGQVGWFVLLLALAVGLVVFVSAGLFAGRRARLGGILLGVLLVADLGRADLPYIIHWDYKQKYDIDSVNPAISTNPIVNFLRDKPYEHRVAYALPWPMQTPPQFGLFYEFYRIEWAQHHFPYYNIESLDKIQMPRMPVDLEAFESALRLGVKQDSSGQWTLDTGTFPRTTRLWELTNTRYLLGPAGLFEVLNEQFDPTQHRFRLIQRFSVLPRPGIAVPDGISPEQFANYLTPSKLTAVPNADGPYGLIEFTGALPRARLYSNWQVITNGEAAVQMLANPGFNPQQTVLLSTPLPNLPAVATNENSGTVEFKSYSPKNIIFNAQAAAPSVLLLNDMFDPHWQVSVDGKPAELLRCNFIMRGVFLTPGPQHTVEFQFKLPNKPLYITLTAIGVGILLCGFLFISARRSR